MLAQFEIYQQIGIIHLREPGPNESQPDWVASLPDLKAAHLQILILSGLSIEKQSIQKLKMISGALATIAPKILLVSKEKGGTDTFQTIDLALQTCNRAEAKLIIEKRRLEHEIHEVRTRSESLREKYKNLDQVKDTARTTESKNRRLKATVTTYLTELTKRLARIKKYHSSEFDSEAVTQLNSKIKELTAFLKQKGVDGGGV